MGWAEVGGYYLARLSFKAYYMEKVQLLEKLDFLTKDEYNKWGQFGFFEFMGKGGTELKTLKYFAGIDDSNLVESSRTRLEYFKNGIVFTISSNNKSYAYGIKKTDLHKIAIEKQDDIVINREVKKEKSVIGRAIAGGLLFGGVGAVIGGLSGLKNDNKIETTVIKNKSFVSFFYLNNNKEAIVLFEVDNKQLADTVKFFSKEYFRNLLEYSAGN